MTVEDVMKKLFNIDDVVIARNNAPSVMFTHGKIERGKHYVVCGTTGPFVILKVEGEWRTYSPSYFDLVKAHVGTAFAWGRRECSSNKSFVLDERG